MKEGFRVKLYQQHFERVNYNMHTRHVKIHLMSPRIRPIDTKRSTINISCRPSMEYRIQNSARVARIQTFGYRRGNLICFPVSHVYSFVGGGPNSIAKLSGDPWPEFPPESTTESL